MWVGRGEGADGGASGGLPVLLWHSGPEVASLPVPLEPLEGQGSLPMCLGRPSGLWGRGAPPATSQLGALSHLAPLCLILLM